jgi:hypothetical protein
MSNKARKVPSKKMPINSESRTRTVDEKSFYLKDLFKRKEFEVFVCLLIV